MISVQPHPDLPLARRQSKLAIDFATQAMRSGDLMEAQRLLRDQLAKAPGDANVLTKLAEIDVTAGRIEQASLLLRRAADADPTAERFLTLLRHLERYVGAEAILAEIELIPQDVREIVDIRLLEAVALNGIGSHDREIEIYEELTRRAPDNETLWRAYGDALKTAGRFDEAVAAVRTAIDARPTYGEAYWTLANFKAFRFTSSEISAMRAALKSRHTESDALHFHFALGRALEDRGNYAQSFRHYASAKRMAASTVHPAEMFVTGFVRAAMEAFTKDFFESRRSLGFKGAGPIFVVGLHRSGSTLIEQILDTHPMIEGTTEITVMPQLWDRVVRSGATKGRSGFDELASMDGKALQMLGSEYLDRTKAFRATERPFFIDKLPANWMNVGLIRLALPNAKIIDARRHPMACGFSNFKQHYASGMFFSYSQESIGAFYRDYWRFMAHFDEVQPGAVHRVVNERLIDDPEGEIRRMLDFVGVAFDPACLDFHKNKRAVRTPSAEQVRRPLNRDGVDQWRNYEPWLGPLKAALGPALDHWDD